jgi:hypothetical protein
VFPAAAVVSAGGWSRWCFIASSLRTGLVAVAGRVMGRAGWRRRDRGRVGSGTSGPGPRRPGPTGGDGSGGRFAERWRGTPAPRATGEPVPRSAGPSHAGARPVRGQESPRDLREIHDVPDRDGQDLQERQADGSSTARMHDDLRERIRLPAGRTAQPTAAIIDSQSVKGSEMVARSSGGHEPGRRFHSPAALTTISSPSVLKTAFSE